MPKSQNVKTNEFDAAFQKYFFGPNTEKMWTFQIRFPTISTQSQRISGYLKTLECLRSFVCYFPKRTNFRKSMRFLSWFANSNHFQVHSCPQLKIILYSRIYCYYLTTWIEQPLATSLSMEYKYSRSVNTDHKFKIIIRKWNHTENRTPVMIWTII